VDKPGRLSVGGLSFGRDITDRKQVERANAGLASIVKASDDAIVGVDRNGTMTSWNEVARRIFGYRLNEVIGQPVAILLPRGEESRVQEILAKVLAGERVHFDEATQRRGDAGLVQLSVTVSPVTDGHGRVIAAGAVARDISHEKQAERERERAFQELKEAQRVARVGSWHRDPATSVVSWSDQLYALFGRDPARRSGLRRRPARVHPPRGPERVLVATASPADGMPQFELDFRIHAGDGVERILHARGGPDPIRPHSYLGTCQDVTADRKADGEQARLLRPAHVPTLQTAPRANSCPG
jgi:PAS domain S-box-containing protein